MRTKPCRSCCLLLAIFLYLPASADADTVPPRSPFLSPTVNCLEVLIRDGTDHYGPTNTPVLASILDVKSRSCPSNPPAADEAWRVIRRERRNPAGANLLTDLATLKAMRLVSQITGDQKYAVFADKYVAWYLTHLVDDRGLIWWGWHRHYDLFTDQMTGHLANHHEIHATHEIPWAQLWKINPGAVRREIEAIWQWHVIDKKTGEVDRHGEGGRGCDFAMTAGACAEAFAFLYQQSGQQLWLDRTLLLANYYWDRRNPKTDLFPDRPNAGSNRFDGAHFLTSDTGLFCHALLKCSELTGSPRFREQAVTYLKAYGRYGFDKKTGKFWGSLNLDGTPVPGPRVSPGGKAGELVADDYRLYEPRGHLDLWQPYAAGYEQPIATAQVFAYAALVTGDPDLRGTAEQFARWIKTELPPHRCETNTWYAGYAASYAPKGTYAGLYGQTISFFIQMRLLTGEDQWLQTARSLASDAIEKLNYDGLFRGHPAKDYYEAMDGVGQFLYALLQLDRSLIAPRDALANRFIPLTPISRERLPVDNW